MSDWGQDFDAVLQSFYRQPDVPRALRAFEGWLRAAELNVIVLHGFTRMAMVSAEVRSGIEVRRELHPRVVDAVLRGFADPAFPRVGARPQTGDELDMLWVEFFVTGNLAPVLRIVGVLDEPDAVRAKVTQWLQQTGSGFLGKWRVSRYEDVLARAKIPARFDTLTVDGPGDLDVGVALAAKAANLKFAELPVSLTQEELLLLAAKSAAVWSLQANANTHAPIAELCRAEAGKPGGAARRLLVAR